MKIWTLALNFGVQLSVFLFVATELVSNLIISVREELITCPQSLSIQMGPLNSHESTFIFCTIYKTDQNRYNT